jgi:hypothetical protein
MRKLLLTLMMLLVSTVAFAGSYYDYSMEVDEYDQSGTYYYNGVEIKEEGGLLKSDDRKTVDIAIVNQTTGKTTYFFSGTNNEEIVTFAYEDSYDTAKGAMVFNRSERGAPVKNNANLPKRAPKDKVLLVTYDKAANIYKMWFSDKAGKKPEKVRQYGREVEWHIDLKSSTIKFITQADRAIRVEAVDW